MLRFVFTDVTDEQVILDSPLALTINQEEDVPADDMTAVFPFCNIKEQKEVSVYDNDELIFTGVVDEQQRISSDSGAFLKIIARSMAAKLLDNESIPISYSHPSADVIFDRHLKPCGIKKYNGEDTTYFGQQTAVKGMTNWQVLRNFCRNALSCTPRINRYGEADLCGVKNDNKVVFSNDGDGIFYDYFKESIRRCEQISRVYVKVTNSSGYLNTVEDKNALSRGIQRERYLNAVLTDTPMTCADAMIENGRKKSYVVTIECPSRQLAVLGSMAVVKDSVSGDIDNLYVSCVRYTLNSKLEKTIITLKRKDD